MSAAAAAAPIAIAVPVATLAYLVFRRGKKKKDEEQPPATTTATKEDYGDLDSIVSFSSRVIAAARAVEHERPDAFIRDPLAEALAGERAMKVARQRAEAAEAESASASEQQPAAAADSSSTKPPRAVPRLVMRTAFLDDAVLVAASGGAESASARRLLSTPKAADALAPLAEHVRAFASSPQAPPVHRLQVVLLGAGMDARPWRLSLPPGRVRWIEVDRADVIAAKKKALAAIGAEVPCSDSSSRPTSASAPQQPAPPLVAPPQQQRPASSSSSAVAVGSTTATAVAAASAPSSASASARPSAPVSIRSLQRSQSAAAAAAALGLPPDVVATAASATSQSFKFPLKASAWSGVAADLTKPGWTSALEREAGFDPRVPTLWVAEGLLYYLDPPTVPGMLSEAASVSAPGSALVATIITDATLEAMRGSKEEQETVKNNTSTPISEQVLSSAPALTSQFVWGAPAADVDGYFSASGWRPLQRPTWSKAAEGYGWRAERRAGSRVPEESQVQFLVAAVDKVAGR